MNRSTTSSTQPLCGEGLAYRNQPSLQGKYGWLFSLALLASIGFSAAGCATISDGHTVDIIVVGGGCAGLAAGFTAAYLNHSVVIFAGDKPGGQLMGSMRVENIPGIIPQGGAAVIDALERQAVGAGASVEYSSVVDVVRTPGNQYFVVHTSGGERWYARALVLAMGGTSRLLAIPGEDELLNERIFTCAICDGRQVEGKRVYIVGGGDASVDAVVTLKDFEPSACTLLVRSERMRAAPRVQERLQHTGVAIEYGTRIREIRRGAEGVVLLLETPRGLEQRGADFVFYAIGHMPNTTMPWVQRLVSCDVQGYIVVDRRQATSTLGIFAAGDIASPHFHQASYAIGCGQFAAKSAIDYINGQ